MPPISPAPQRSRARTPGSRFLLALSAGILTWGALAFGAVYPWAYWPLGIACAIAGAIGLTTAPKSTAGMRAVAMALILLTAAVLIQLVPIPRPALDVISPKSEMLLTRYDLRYVAAAAAPGIGGASGPQRAHALSIDPRRTWTALALLVGFGLLLTGLARRLEKDIVIPLVRTVIGLGLVMAVVGLIQQASYNGRIYGFWTPESRGVLSPFGPFVNRNHYAGWMLMAVPLAFGFFLGRMSEATEDVSGSWRRRLLWLSTPAASGLVVTAFAVAVMVMSVAFSLSRSGIGCLIAGLIGLGLFALRRLTNRAGNLAVASFLVLAVVLSIGWAGSNRVAVRFDEFRRDAFGGRAGVWSDAWRIARAYPLAGTGLGTFGLGMLFYQTPPVEKRYSEAHNDYLQLAAEGGWLLAVPALILLALLSREIRRRFAERRDDQRIYWIRVGAVAGLCSIALQALVDFSLQMPGNAALFCVLMAIALHRSSDGPAGSRLAGARRFTPNPARRAVPGRDSV